MMISMARLFFLLCFCVASIGWADADWEDDEFDCEVKTLSYGGMEIECDAGCGDISQDPNLREIHELFKTSLKNTINGPAGLIEPQFTWQINPISWKGGDYDRYYSWFEEFDGRQCPEISVSNHSDFLVTASVVKEDLYFYHQIKQGSFEEKIAEEQKYLDQLQSFQSQGCRSFYCDDKGNLIGTSEDGDIEIEAEVRDCQRKIARFRKKIAAQEVKFDEYNQIVDSAFQQMDALFRKMFVRCLEIHQPEGIAFCSAIEHLLAKEFDEAFEQIRFLIDLSEKNGFDNQTLSKLYLLRGQIESEFGLYADAILTLTTSIQKDSSLKDAYLERAIAYFELGQFDRAVEDYLHSGFQNGSKKSRLQWKDIGDFSAGIAMGIVQGAEKSALDFIPSVLGSLEGMGNGLWAFCANPVGASKNFAKAAIECVETLKAQFNYGMLQELVPELKVVLESYDRLNEYEKGTAIGTIVGKYGIDIFLGKTSVSAIKTCRNLKTADRLMTLEALASSKNSSKVIESAARHSAKREAFLKQANLKIQADKQGKHIVGHRNYDPEGGKSIFQHPNPERLVLERAGTGIKESNAIPGTSGYKEVVNFKEFIGYAVDEFSGEKTATTWGKIHYAKGGVHIVPTKPR